MAEIKIERKKGIPVWAILLAAIVVLALIVWAFVANRNHTNQNVNNTAVLQWSAPAPVHHYVPATRCA
jgi:amino acid transporter